MKEINEKINRALKAGGYAVGADVKITEIPGYLPILRYPEYDEIFANNLVECGVKAEDIIDGGDFTGSFDFGDISHLMPTIHPMIAGVKGALHTREYEIIDEKIAYILPAKAMALTIVDLLFDNAQKANEILDKFEAKMTKEEYLEYLEENDKTI
jgi:metal-dependent amidase/aminoacylase/carboxypeptidase family protein